MFSLTLFYGIIVLVLVIGAFFIVYHILRYSLSSFLGYFGALFFGSVFLLLLFINFLSFQSLESETSLPVLELGPIAPNPVTPLAPNTRNPW